MMEHQLLLVCADGLEARLLALALEEAGVSVTAVAAAEDAGGVARPDLILLVNHDGRYLGQAAALRRSGAPLLLLADYRSEDDHIAALREGVDLILFRPYSIRFLAAQIPALLRCFPPAGDSPAVAPDSGRGATAGRGGAAEFRLNTQTQTLHFAGGQPARLSHLEFRLLQTLMNHPRQVIPTGTIIERVYGYAGDGDEQLVRKLVCRLRAKLQDSGREPRFIHTIPGIGYSFHDEGEPRARAVPNPQNGTPLAQLLGRV